MSLHIFDVGYTYTTIISTSLVYGSHPHPFEVRPTEDDAQNPRPPS